MTQRHIKGKVIRSSLARRGAKGLGGLITAIVVSMACGDDSGADETRDDGTCALPAAFVLSALQMSGDCSLDRADEALRFLQSDAPECDASHTCVDGVLSASLSCRAGDVGTVRWQSSTNTGTYNLRSDDCNASYALELEDPF